MVVTGFGVCAAPKWCNPKNALGAKMTRRWTFSGKG
jgi:hypothetical protein